MANVIYNWQVHLAPCLILDVDLADGVDNHTSELVMMAYKTVREMGNANCKFSDDRILYQKKGREKKQEFKCTEEKARRVRLNATARVVLLQSVEMGDEGLPDQDHPRVRITEAGKKKKDDHKT